MIRLLWASVLCACASLHAAEPGKFDYYMLSLSWSPDFCATHSDAAECGGAKKYGFIVHGLWPQYERGYPDTCPGAPFDPRQMPRDIEDAMPAKVLFRHEWTKHGTCSGLPQKRYFELIEQAYQKVTIPKPYQQPLQNVEVSPRTLKQNFERANPTFPRGAFSVQCARGRFVSEVRACFTKNLEPRACGSDIRDTCRADTVILRPVR